MSDPFARGPAAVRVPATSANLGPGFDALGLALQWHDDVVAEIADGLQVAVDGAGSALPRDETHLVVRAMRATFDRLGGQPRGIRLTSTNRIPHGRGLGSSAAAIVAGVLLARALVRDGAQALPDGAAFALAAELEGHPDNVAACFFGGVTIAWTEAGVSRAVRHDVNPALAPVVLVPPFESSTRAARGLLPGQVPHGDAAFNAARCALLVAALCGAVDIDSGALLAATADRLHQPFRAPAMPASAEVMNRLRADGLAAVISGAGPTVLVLTRSEDDEQWVRAAAPPGWTAHAVPVDDAGATIRLP